MRQAWKLLARSALALLALSPTTVGTAHAETYVPTHSLCGYSSPICPDVAEPQRAFGHYSGHDEPSLLFYSNQAGSGNSNLYTMRLPQDPPVQPTDAGTGGTWNFQLHPAFWFGMALCDNQSAPKPSNVRCQPDSDKNIFDSGNPAAKDYIGKHPGTAFLEMQLYPPGWVAWPASQIINGGSSCDATKWCAALVIFSFQQDMNTGVVNNASCQAQTGVESLNFAFVTKNGKPTGPPDPMHQTTAGTYTPDKNRDLFMSSGDVITVDMHDTRNGLSVGIQDQTTGERGSMTASAKNGFAQVLFEPNSPTCHEKAYDFHPMYSTSSEHTRVPWGAHTYNVAFSDEIGHFEYCPQTVGELGSANCAPGPTASDPAGADRDDKDGNCASKDESTLVQISGCTGTDRDFDGVAYKAKSWPGTGTPNSLVSTPIIFTSPLFHGDQNYQRVAFEADLPAIQPFPQCSHTTGAGCLNPPPGADFYPIYSTGKDLASSQQEGDNQGDNQGDKPHIAGCVWQFGGPAIPGTTNNFGGNSVTEYGAIFKQEIPGIGPRVENNRRILNHNPCPTGEGDNQGGDNHGGGNN